MDDTNLKGLVTLLQVASAAGQEEVTRWLLEDLRADPTVPVLSRAAAATRAPSGAGFDSEGENAPGTGPGSGTGRTAYTVATSKGVRNVFRRAAYAHPDWLDWETAARVPSVLSPELEEEQGKKKEARRKGLKEKMKEREEAAKLKSQAAEADAKIKEAEEAAQRKKMQAAGKASASAKGGPQKLGGTGSSGADGVAGLSAEMRTKIERERRARAAEARLGGGGR